MLIFEKQQYIFESPSDFKVVIKSRKDNNGNDLSLYPMKYTFFDSYNNKYECWYNSEEDKKNCVYNGDSIELIFEKYKLLGRISYIEYFSVADNDFSDGTRDTYCTYVSPFYIKSLYGGNCGQCDNNEIFAAAKVDVIMSADVVCDDTLSLTSENPVQNKVITQALNDKVDKEDGKVLSDNNFTDENKTKLDSLENYDDSAIITSLNTKVDKIAGKELSSNDFTDADKTKLDGLENYDDTKIKADLEKKVDKEIGKGLSTNDFTTAEKTKLAGLKNTIVDSELSTTSKNPVQNKVIAATLGDIETILDNINGD